MTFNYSVFLQIITYLSIVNYGMSLKIICYWPSGRRVDVINPHLCTHIHYSFFILDEVNAAPVDEIGYPNIQVYQQLNALKQNNSDLKIIAAIGGWGDDAGKYSRVVANDTTRRQFVVNSLNMILEYGFDGFDLDWEFPVCWQDNCTAGDDKDRDNFSKLIQVSFNSTRV